MPAKIILNPYAGRWSALQRKTEVEYALQETGISYELVLTQHPGHGSELAKQAVLDGFSPIISAGGDGSISEVVNGVIQGTRLAGREQPVPVGILPLGSANDLAVNLKLPKNLKAAAEVIAGGKTRAMDLGFVQFDQDGGQRYFDNNSAVGLEPTITLIQQRIQRLRGVLRYIIAALIGIARNPQWNMEVEWQGGSYSGMANLVTVGNLPVSGGFYLAPHADAFDGLLTFVYGSIPSRMEILKIFPRTMKPGPGNYVEHPRVHEIHTPWLRIRTETPTPLHADGEIQSEKVQEVEYRILPASLPILMN